jgi:DNA polymerase-3 subunit beta
MKINTTQLSKYLEPCLQVIRSGAAINPILDNVCFDGDYLTATNQETTALVKLEAPVDKPFLVPAAKLAEICKVNPNEELEITPDGSKVVLKIGRKKYSLTTLPAEDFPQIGNDIHTMTSLDVTGFSEAVAKVVYAIPSKDHRRVLMGVRFDGKRVIATDGKRLAYCKVEEHPDVSFTMDADVAQMIARHPVDSVSVGDGLLFVSFGNVTIRTRPLEGRYPDINAVIPRDFKSKPVFDRDELVGALRSCLVTADDKQLTAIVNMVDGVASVSSMAHDVGSCNASVEYSDGSNLEFAVNAKFMIETLKKCGEKVTLNLCDAQRPIVINEGALLMVVMPIKLADVRKAEVAA